MDSDLHKEDYKLVEKYQWIGMNKRNKNEDRVKGIYVP